MKILKAFGKTGCSLPYTTLYSRTGVKADNSEAADTLLEAIHD